MTSASRDDAPMREMGYRDALREALHEALLVDEQGPETQLTVARRVHQRPGADA